MPPASVLTSTLVSVRAKSREKGLTLRELEEFVTTAKAAGATAESVVSIAPWSLELQVLVPS